MKSIAIETKVGIFVVLGIIILAFFTIRVGRIAVREVGYRIYTHVESAAGLDKNSPVRIAGVEVGKVEGIVLDGAKARVTLHLPLNVKIPVGSKAYVKSSGLLGEKYIEIVFGTGPEPIKANGQVEEGGPSVDVDRVLTQLSSIGEDIKSVTQSLSHALGGEKGEQTIKELVGGAKETVSNLQNITQAINKGEGTIGKLVKDDTLYTQTKETLVEAKETLANLNKVSKQIESGEGTLGKLVKDDALYTETKATMVEARETLANLNKVSKQIESGEGTLGKLVKDDTLYTETKATMVEAKETLANLKKVSEQIEKGEGTLGKLVKDDTLYTEAKATMVEAKETLANLNKVSKQIESGEGTLGKLVKDDTLYDETKKAIKSVNKAAEGIQEVTPVTVLGVILGIVLK
ncbi:MAG: MlaD family protein [Deltaproteobacteria bacterium]|nr:MlaD family protein [Deltaproteobacteria bacterium]